MSIKRAFLLPVHNIMCSFLKQPSRLFSSFFFKIKSSLSVGEKPFDPQRAMQTPSPSFLSSGEWARARGEQAWTPDPNWVGGPGKQKNSGNSESVLSRMTLSRDERCVEFWVFLYILKKKV